MLAFYRRLMTAGLFAPEHASAEAKCLVMGVVMGASAYGGSQAVLSSNERGKTSGENMSLHADLRHHLESCVAELNLPGNPYCKMLCAGEMSKQQFLKSQVEFAPMVFFFSRPMAHLIANVPYAPQRIALVGNLWEEHGNGLKEKIHGKTIFELIDRLGGDSSSIDLSKPSPNVRIFNETLRSISSFEDYRFLFRSLQVSSGRSWTYRR